MPRSQKNNAEYFKHYTGLRNHRKVKMLKNKFGNVIGYAFWCMMLEWLTEHDGLEWEYSELEIEMFSSELGVSAAEIPPMVEYATKIELLFKSADGFIYSESLNEELNPVFEKRKKEREKSKTRKRREDGTFKTIENTTTLGVSAAEIPHSREEKSIEEKSNIIVGLSTPTPTKQNSDSDRCQKFVAYFNEKKSSKYQVTEKVKRAFKKAIKNYSTADLAKVIDGALKDKNHIETELMYVTPEFVLRSEIIERYRNIGTTTKPVSQEPRLKI